jgi:isopentenyl diphosphate isomerase/L-lactate dehydrogenase-like FMN-dependent dehydrogenase
MSPKDAVLAAEAGVDGILLSNHGGNRLAYYVVQMLTAFRASTGLVCLE